MKKLIVGSSALALVLTAGFFAATASGSAPHGAGAAASTTTSTPAAPVTSRVQKTPPTAASTTTTTLKPKPKPVDPVAGAVVLNLHDRDIDAIDANGHVVKHLVTVFADRIVDSARLMADHHTIWYQTSPNGPNGPTTNRCTDVVRLDLLNNRRTVIAHADNFSVSANGQRVALRDVQAEGVCNGTASWVPGVNVVRDVTTGKQSPIVGDTQGTEVLSPGGHVLVATHCRTDEYEDCPSTLETAAVPDVLGAPVTFHDINSTELSFGGLVARVDGLYTFVDTIRRECGCTGPPADRTDSAVSVRRLSWSALDAPGTTLFTVHGPLEINQLAVASNGLYAMGTRNVHADQELFHLGADGAHVIRSVDTMAAFVGTIDPWIGG